MSFDILNREAEEDAGLVKRKTEVERAAEDYAIALHALQGMERMYPRPSPEVFAENRQFLREAEEKLRLFSKVGTHVEAAKRAAIQEQRSQDMQQRAILQAWKKSIREKILWSTVVPKHRKSTIK